jgi:hypothetical protein
MAGVVVLHEQQLRDVGVAGGGAQRLYLARGVHQSLHRIQLQLLHGHRRAHRHAHTAAHERIPIVAVVVHVAITTVAGATANRHVVASGGGSSNTGAVGTVAVLVTTATTAATATRERGA